MADLGTCLECGMPFEIGGKTLNYEGRGSGRVHRRAFQFPNGCLAALMAEVAALRAEIDYLRDLVETPTEKIVVCQMTGIEHRA